MPNQLTHFFKFFKSTSFVTARPPVTASPLDERPGEGRRGAFSIYRLARISHKVSLRDRSNACPIRLRGQKDAEGILAIRRGGLREQSLMGWLVQSVRMNRPQQEVCEKCGLEAYFPYVRGKRRGRQQSLSPRG